MIARALTASLGLGLAVLPAATRAACVAAEFRGTVTASFDLAGTAGYGEGPGVLDGLTVSGVIAFDAALAPPDAEPSPELGVYATRNATVHWMPLILLHLNGRMLEPPRFAGASTSRDTDERLHVSGDGVLSLMRDLDIHDSITGEYLDYAVSLRLDGSSRAGDALPAELSAIESTTGRGSATLMYQAPNRPMGVHVGLDFRLLALEPRDPAGLPVACGGV